MPNAWRCEYKKLYTWNKITSKTIKCCIFFHWNVLKREGTLHLASWQNFKLLYISVIFLQFYLLHTNHRKHRYMVDMRLGLMIIPFLLRLLKSWTSHNYNLTLRNLVMGGAKIFLIANIKIFFSPDDFHFNQLATPATTLANRTTRQIPPK